MIIKAIMRKMIPQSIRDQLVINYEEITTHYRNFSINPPIIIYQMGKVGSTTVFRSLKNAKMPNPIYTVHCLSEEGIKRAEDHYLELQPTIPRHIKKCSILSRKIEEDRFKTHWNIITLVREPIQRIISDFFQNVKDYWPNLVDLNGKVKKDDALVFLDNMLNEYDETTDYASTWFDREIKTVFYIDVFSYPFDHNNGFSIINERNIRLLIFRLEDINLSFDNGINKFLKVDKPIQMVKSNVGKAKDYSEEYEYVLEHLTLPISACTRIYSSKYARHFYTEGMRNELIHKWSREQE